MFDVGITLHEAGLAGGVGIDDGEDGCAVVLAEMAKLLGVVVHEFIATRPRQPVDEFPARRFLLMEGPVVRVAADIKMRLFLHVGGPLRPVHGVPHGVAGKIMGRPDAALLLVGEYQLELSLPFLHRNQVCAHRPQQRGAVVPQVMVPQKPDEPPHAVPLEEVLHQLPPSFLRGILIPVEPEKAAGPVVVGIADRGPEHSFGRRAQFQVPVQEGPIATVVVDVRIAEPHDADGAVDLDLIRHPLFSFVVVLALGVTLLHALDDFLDRDIVVGDVGHFNIFALADVLDGAFVYVCGKCLPGDAEIPRRRRGVTRHNIFAGGQLQPAGAFLFLRNGFVSFGGHSD